MTGPSSTEAPPILSVLLGMVGGLGGGTAISPRRSLRVSAGRAGPRRLKLSCNCHLPILVMLDEFAYRVGVVVGEGSLGLWWELTDGAVY